MEYLRAAAEELGLRRIIDAVAPLQDVQGAILNFDRTWLSAWRAFDRDPSFDWDSWFNYFYYHWDRGRYFPFERFDWLPPDDDLWIPRTTPGLTWRPPWWGLWSELRSNGKSPDLPPVRLTVVLRPPRSGGEGAVLPELPEAALPVDFETRPVARLAAGERSAHRPILGGISLGEGATTYGTLGGILHDGAGTKFGSTCAHVFPSATSVDQPAQYDLAGATPIGSSRAPIRFAACPGISPACNPYINHPHISNVDTTLVDLSVGTGVLPEILGLGPIAGPYPRTSMTPGQAVTFVGRTSGRMDLEVGGLGVFYRLSHGGSIYCFRDLFEIRRKRSRIPFAGPPVQAGDSGAWVCIDGHAGLEWCGQAIGEDRGIGYACFADFVLDEWSKAGTNLVVA